MKTDASERMTQKKGNGNEDEIWRKEGKERERKNINVCTDFEGEIKRS